MKRHKLMFALLVAVATVSRTTMAATFIYSYTFSSGLVLSGSLEGEPDGAGGVANVRNVTVFFDGASMSGPILTRHFAGHTGVPETTWADGAVVSFAADGNNLLFANNLSFDDEFFLISHGSEGHSVAQAYSARLGFYAFDNPTDFSAWSLTLAPCTIDVCSFQVLDWQVGEGTFSFAIDPAALYPAGTVFPLSVNGITTILTGDSQPWDPSHSSLVLYDNGGWAVYLHDLADNGANVSNLLPGHSSPWTGQEVMDAVASAPQLALLGAMPVPSPCPVTIVCPENITTDTAPGQCSQIVNFAVNTTGESPVVVCDPPSGSAFPKGTTTVNCTATDASGNQATCSFTITVNDIEAPVITCPTDIMLPCGTEQLVSATFASTATDNCDPAPVVTYSIAPGAGFPVGETTVTATATDDSGNFSQCTFTVNRAALGFTGFLPPIGGADGTGGSFSSTVRTFKLGSTIPVKFTASCDNVPVLAGIHTLEAIRWSSQTDAEPPIDATPTDAATTGNQFRLTDGEWHFNLDTKATGMSIGKWQLIATLSDGSQHSVWIQIK